MLQTLLYSNTATGLAGLGWAVATLRTLHMPMDLALVLLSFLLVQSLYIRDRLSGRHVQDDAVNEPVRSLWLQKRAGMLTNLALVQGLLAVLLLCQRPAVLRAIIPGMLMVWMYTAKVLPGGRSLKQLPGQKCFYVAGLWNLLCVWIPICFNALPGPRPAADVALLVGAAQFCCDAALTNLNDLRDVDGDAKAGTSTLPVLLGRRAGRTVSVALGVAAAAMGCAAGAPAFAAIGLYVAVLSLLYDHRQHKLALFSLLIESTGFFAGVLSLAVSPAA